MSSSSNPRSADALWEGLRDDLPVLHREVIPLVRRDLEDAESEAVNADTNLLLLVRAANANQVGKIAAEQRQIITDSLAARGAQLDALELASSSIVETLPLLREAVRVAQESESRAISDRRAMEAQMQFDRGAFAAAEAALLAAWKEELAVERKSAEERSRREQVAIREMIGRVDQELARRTRLAESWERTARIQRGLAWTLFILVIVLVAVLAALVLWGIFHLTVPASGGT